MQSGQFSLNQAQLLDLDKPATPQMRRYTQHNAIDPELTFQTDRHWNWPDPRAPKVVDQFHSGMGRRDGGRAGFFERNHLPAARDGVFDACRDLVRSQKDIELSPQSIKRAAFDCGS